MFTCPWWRVVFLHNFMWEVKLFIWASWDIIWASQNLWHSSGLTSGPKFLMLNPEYVMLLSRCWFGPIVFRFVFYPGTDVKIVRVHFGKKTQPIFSVIVTNECRILNCCYFAFTKITAGSVKKTLYWKWLCKLTSPSGKTCVWAADKKFTVKYLLQDVTKISDRHSQKDKVRLQVGHG